MSLGHGIDENQTMSLTADEIFTETLEIRSRLDRLDDESERIRLEERLTELRALAVALDGGSGRVGLEAHLHNLERRLQRILDGHLSQSAAAQTGRGGGIDPEYVHRLNRQIDEGAGVDALRADIARVRRLLDEG